jgi:hypothetical protein
MRNRRRPDSKLPASVRKDGRGHWPAGVRRHALQAGVLEALRIAQTSMSLAQIAAVIGTDSRTVHRWVTGKNHPHPLFQERILRHWGPTVGQGRPRRRSTTT